jgi:hypothetical protein
MRIATWNMEFKHGLSKKRAEAFKEAMSRIGADVWVLTETWTSFSPGHGYGLISSSRWANNLADCSDRRQDERRWAAIWSRLPARMLEVRNDPQRMTCARIEQQGRLDVVAVGTVLPSHGEGGDAAFRASLQAQAPEWSLLWGNPRRGVLCVAGDFNRPLAGPVQGFSHSSQASLVNALAGLNLVCTTTHLPAQVNDGYCAIDHICIASDPPPLTIGPADRFPGAPLSDHDGYYVDLEIPPA